MSTKLNKSDYILIAIIYIVTIVFNTIDYYREGNLLKEYFIDFSAGVITSLSAVLLFMYWLIPNFLVKQKKYFSFIFFGLLILLILGIIDFTAGFWSAESNWAKYPKGLDFVLKCIFRITDEAGLVLGLLLTKKFYESQTEFLQVEKQQKENELKLLRGQLDPHFLFNNLNTLDSLIDSNPTKAKEYINRLSLIYRYLIQTKDAEVMELAEELELAKNYIFLIKTRFGDDYEFIFEENIDVNDKFIPTGALQTLLENVVKHNKCDGTKPIKTILKINKGWIIVTNTKSKTISKNESFGTGLQNLKARYKLLSDEKIQVHDMDTKFEIFIPIIELSS
jgi:two-component system, LytTR family, sensor kinase